MKTCDCLIVVMQYLISFIFPLIRLLYSVKVPVPVLVFEDATKQGYGLSSGPLNIDGVKFVASKLAKFHAASVYLDRDVRLIAVDVSPFVLYVCS